MKFRAVMTAALRVLLLLFFPEISSVAATQTPATAAERPMFATEYIAQAHYSNDKSVWLNTASGIYDEKRMRWSKKTKVSTYICRQEADATADRYTRNAVCYRNAH
jgi:hypothetical protein